MAYEHKEGMGALFENGNKSGNQPDYSGNIMINGEVVKLAAWFKEKNGKRYFSLSVDNFVPKEKTETPF